MPEDLIMAIFTWNDSYSVGVNTIDVQHRKLVDMINKLNDAMSQGNGNLVLAGTFSDLLKYAATHFAVEETFMRKFNYPLFPQHKAEHDKLTQKAVMLKKELDDGKIAMSVQTIVFLKDWLINHILRTDKMYSTCFNENGLN